MNAECNVAAIDVVVVLAMGYRGREICSNRSNAKLVNSRRFGEGKSYDEEQGCRWSVDDTY